MNGQPLNEFELLRQKAMQRARKEGQRATEALQRRFAALGGLQTGAAIKAQQVAQQEAQRIGEERLGDIDIAEAAERQRRKEITEGREFQAGEAAKVRAQQAEQFAKTFGLQEKGFEFGKETKLRELGLAERELSLNEDIAAFNKQIALAELGRPTDIFGQLLGPQFSTSKFGSFNLGGYDYDIGKGVTGGLLGGLSGPAGTGIGAGLGFL